MMRRVDVLPEAYRRRRRERQITFGIIAVGAIIVVLLVVWWLILGSQVNSQKQQLADQQAHNAQLQAQISRLQHFANLQQEVQSKKTALSTAMQGDVDWPSVLTELAMVIPGDTWLESLSASAGNTEGATPADTETNPIRLAKQQPYGRIQFTGDSLNMPAVAKWLIALQGVKDFQAAWLDSADTTTIGNTNVISFQNTIELNSKAAAHRFQGATGP